MPGAGTITCLWTSPAKGQPMMARGDVEAIADLGFAGCAHGRRGSARQVLLMEASVLSEAGVAAGQLKENVTTTGLPLQHLSSGTLLRLGDDVILEITRPCHPCRKIESIKRGLAEELQGTRGVLARVITGGRLHVGAAIAVVTQPSALRVAA